MFRINSTSCRLVPSTSQTGRPLAVGMIAIRLSLSLLMVCAAGPQIQAEVAPGAATTKATLNEFAWPDHLSKVWTQAEFADQPVVVIAVLGTECPLARQYALTLNQFAQDYANRGVAVIGVNANPQDAPTEIAAQVRQQKLTYPLLKDVNQDVLRLLGAERTPEVFVLDAQRVVRYRGRVDDQHSIGSRSRPAPSRSDLRCAVDELLAGHPVSVPRTEASGCLIGTLQAPDNSAGVTYSNQISRLFHQHCVECHRPGEIGPFSLTSYEDARGWAEMIEEVTRQKRMPPWHANPAHGEFANARGLTSAEQTLIADWVAAGAPEGNPAELPAPLVFAPGWQLPRQPDRIIPMADQPFSVPASGEVRYQHFVVDPGFTTDQWVSGAEIIPGNRAVVHHVIVFASPDGKFFDGERQFIMAYVPGLRVKPYAEGMAKKIPAGSKFIFQIHYTPNGSALQDLTSIGLIFANPEQLTHEIRTESVVGRKIELVPEKANQKFNTVTATAPADLLLLSLSPHMHVRGQSFRYELTWPDGRVETLLDVPHYDFNWQTAYLLKTPLAIPAGAKLRGLASFDNSAQNLANPDPSATVRWGDQSWEEMLIGYFDVAIPIDGGSQTTQRMTQRPGEKLLAGLMKSVDRNQDRVLQRSEVPNRFDKLFKKLDADGNQELSEAELLTGLPELRDSLRGTKPATP